MSSISVPVEGMIDSFYCKFRVSFWAAYTKSICVRREMWKHALTIMATNTCQRKAAESWLWRRLNSHHIHSVFFRSSLLGCPLTELWQNVCGMWNTTNVWRNSTWLLQHGALFLWVLAPPGLGRGAWFSILSNSTCTDVAYER